MKQRPMTAKNANRSTLTVPVAAAMAMTLLALLASQGFAADDTNSHSYAAAQPGTAGQFGLVEASGLRWLHLSSRHGDLPVPTTSHQQTAAVVADLAKDGGNGFVLAFRENGPALVWYRRTKTGWERYVIEKEFLPLEAGGAICDIDGDGYPDLVFGGDYQSNKVWWWRNPGKDWKPGVPWERHTIKINGATQHHDQCIADFKGTGKPQLAYWNQQAKTLFCRRYSGQSCARSSSGLPRLYFPASPAEPLRTPKACRLTISTAMADRNCWPSIGYSST